MKSAFKSVERLGKKLSSIVLGCLLAMPLAAVAQQATYNSPPTVTGIPPNVNATNFVNSGIWDIVTTAPYETANTLNYTNTGTMTGSVGWEFDCGASAGGRGWSANFFNGNNAPIEAVDGEILNGDVGNTTLDEFLASYLLVSATNIVNKGLLAAGPNGEMILSGSEVSLGRSSLEITPLVGVGSIVTATNFAPDAGIYDEYWLAGTNKLTVTGSPWDGTTIPTFTAINAGLPCGATATETIGPFTPQVSDSYSNSSGPKTLTLTNSAQIGNPAVFTTTNVTVYSNTTRQAIFVFVSDTNLINATTRFGPSVSSTNPFHAMAVRLAVELTNVITATLQTSTIYVVDSLGTATNQGLSVNAVINPSAICTDPTFRPATVDVSRTDPGTYGAGSPGLGPPSSTFLYDPSTFTNFVATGRADVYSALVDDLAAEPPPGLSISNAPGKINIYAKDLDLTKTKISAASEILIQATNLISSAGAIVDCQNLSYNLGSTNGYLNVTNLAGQSVQRLRGTITEWSGLWTNHAVTLYPTLVLDSTGTNWVPSNVTNVTEVDIAITVVDASGLSNTIPVIVQDLILHSTNMVVSDSMTVTNSMLFDGQSLTIQNGLVLATGIQNWNNSVAPTLRFFTNNGTLEIPQDAHFGDDGPTNYAAFVNHGSIFSQGQTINSDYLEISGVGGVTNNKTLASDFIATCKTGTVVNAEIISEAGIQFFAGSLQIDPSTLSAGGAIDFIVTNSLSDAGFKSGNTFTCNNGFNLFIKPATGDLLGTVITDVAQSDDEVDHSWAGLDRGTNYAGFTNNVAVGELALVAQNTLAGDPLFRFTGTGSSNAMYVGYLDLSQLSNNNLAELKTELQIDPGMVIYYANAKLGFTPPSGTAAQYLDGQVFGGGQLKWVQGYTSQATTLSDSYVNGGGGGSSLQLSLTGIPGQPYIIQTSTNLVSGNWVDISTNDGGAFTFSDTNVMSYPDRFYRAVVVQ